VNILAEILATKIKALARCKTGEGFGDSVAFLA